MKSLFSHDHAWSGGFFELAVELGARSDDRLRSALCKVWEHPTLSGCYRQSDREPELQVRIDPGSLDVEETVYGVANIPGIGTTCCLTTVLRVEDRSDWLMLGVPMGSLSLVADVGAYPFADSTDLSWRLLMQAWLRQVADSIFETVPFQLGLIDHDVLGEIHAEDVRRGGIPHERWFGYLWPANGRLQWFAPTEGAPLSFGG